MGRRFFRTLPLAGLATLCLLTLSPAVQAAAATTHVITSVPQIRQQFSLDCEAAALQMALAHENIHPSQAQELNDIGIDWVHRGAGYTGGGDPYISFVGDPNGSEILQTGYGTYFPTISRIASGYGGRVLVAGEGIAPNAIYDAVLRNHPAVAWVTYDWATPPRHDYRAFDGRLIPYAGPDEHAVTVAGVGSSSVLINDPARGSYWISKRAFEAAFGIYNRMAVVLD